MKKSFILSLVLSSLMYGKGFINPLPNSSKALENGGTLLAIDAYQDGVGVMVLEKGRGIDNSAMNALVFKYGNEAKDNGIVLGDQVLLSGTAEDKLLAGKLYPDGGSCSDGNALTQGETWLNGVCQGGSIPNGTQCDDNNVMTVNDKYVNQICTGTLTVNGDSCDDGVSTTYGDKWLNGVCAGFTNGTVCNDDNSATINDIYTNGVCSGIIASSCLDYKNINPSSASGNYSITLAGRTMNVYCDMTTQGGGWTLAVSPSFAFGKTHSFWNGAGSTNENYVINGVTYNSSNNEFLLSNLKFKDILISGNNSYRSNVTNTTFVAKRSSSTGWTILSAPSQGNISWNLSDRDGYIHSDMILGGTGGTAGYGDYYHYGIGITSWNNTGHGCFYQWMGKATLNNVFGTYHHSTGVSSHRTTFSPGLTEGTYFR